MTNQEIIDKYLNEFNQVQRMQVPIELNPYLHRMITQALHIHGVGGCQCKDGKWHEKKIGGWICSMCGVPV